MSRYRPYPKYKDSGVEWLGAIPDNWDIAKIKHFFYLGRGRVIAQEEMEDDGLFPVYSSQTKNNGVMGYVSTYDFDCKQITWTTDGANAGTVFLREGQHNCTNVCGTLQPKNNNENLEYITYSLQYATQFYKRPDTNGAKIMNGEMAEIFFTFPSPEEQQLIANFLDNATCKIDTLIQKQQNLIALLKEKRQALISHTVTKGLNPHVKMKDSGVEWLGEVPEHWEVVQSRRLFKDRKEKARNDDEQLTASQKYGVIYQKEFMELEGRKVTLVLTGSEILKHVEAGDFVISMRSFQGGLELCKYSGSVSSAYIGLIPIKHVIHDYFKYLFKSITYIQALQSTSNLVRDGQALRFENFSQVDLVIVPEIEQQQIANYLDNATCKIDTLISKAQEAIELLKERRTALISATVTGKIDIRNHLNANYETGENTHD